MKLLMKAKEKNNINPKEKTVKNRKNNIRKSPLNDEKANFSIIIAGLMMIGFLILSVVLLNAVIDERGENQEIISSSQYRYMMNDYIRNIPIIEREALEELGEEVMRNKRPCRDSKGDLKEMIDEKLSIKNQILHDNYNVNVNSSLIAIENTTNPFSYKFKTYISSSKGDYSYENIVVNDVDCINLKDPVPLLYLKDYYGLSYNDSSYNYGKALSEFLKRKGVENYSYYINASSPLIVKKCPYDPYKHHGDDNGKVMKNCRDNGYYHESRDGACYLCRLEGKGGCEHYGFETFINPQRTNETGRVSACGSDHVIFSDDIYPGVEVIYNNESDDDSNGGIPYEILYLDPHGHKVKYGMGAF